MQGQWDIVVIGAGPAGLSAAAAAAADGLSCLCVDRMGPGGQLINLGPLHDMQDIAEGTTGPDLIGGLLDPAMAAGVELLVAEVVGLRREAGWIVETDDGTHRARAVIIASGLSSGTLDVADAAAFEGRGLSHCAACDGPLYAGQNVVVAGDDRWAVQEAIDLAPLAAHVTLIDDADAPASPPPNAAVLTAQANVTVVHGRIVGLVGGDGLQAVTVAQANGRKDLPASAIFVYTRRIPAVSFARVPLDRDASGHIMIDDDLHAGAPLLFAAGDVRAGGAQRIAVAIADGARAGRAAARQVKEEASSLAAGSTG